MSNIPPKVRAALKERAGGCCEVCGAAKATNAHHRKNRSQGGPHALSNLLLLCGSGTTGCHGAVTMNPHWACGRGLSVKSWQDSWSEPVVRWGKWVLLGDGGEVQEIPDPDRSVA